MIMQLLRLKGYRDGDFYLNNNIVYINYSAG